MMNVVAYTRHGIEHPGHDDPKFREAESGQVLLDRWVTASQRQQGSSIHSSTPSQGIQPTPPELPASHSCSNASAPPPWLHDLVFGSHIKRRRCCRVRYKDVLEWLWYLNSHPEVVYKSMHGDKDSFRLAFTLAGKAVNYTQVRVA